VRDREGDDVDLTRVLGAEEVRQAQMPVAPLARERESRALAAVVGYLVWRK
jgi:hypothetical protein